MALSNDHNEITTDYIETLDSEVFTGFLQSLSNLPQTADNQLVSVTLPIAGIDPLAALELQPDVEEKFYWDHPDHQISISAGGNIAELRATGSDRFAEISRMTAEIKERISAFTSLSHSMAGPLFLGGYSFNDHNIGKIWKQFGAARFVLPEWMLVRDGNLHLLTLILEKKDLEIYEIYQSVIEKVTDFLNLAGKLTTIKPRNVSEKNVLCSLQHPDEHSRWIKNVKTARKLIHEGRFEKIVLARSYDVESKCRVRPTVLSHNLRQKYPGCFNFMIQIDQNTSFLGATPERLASFQKGTLLTEGLAGTAGRGKSALEDAAIANSLLQSKKDRSEHDYVVRAIDSSLRPFSYRIEHPKQPRVKKLQNVQHLFTPISASVKSGVAIHQLIEKLHPTPAVGGFPREEAMRYIQHIDQVDRGWYAGPVGWFNLNGSGEFAVAIRSALLHNQRATLFAGCGIVKDSDPEKEWNETLSKLKPMLDALNQLEEPYA